MNRLRIIGLVLLAALLVWLGLRSLIPDTPPPAPAPVPVREAFHPTKPLQVEVRAAAAPETTQTEQRWLVRELRYMLARGQMKVAALAGAARDTSNAPATLFTLRVTLNTESARAEIALVAPDRVVDQLEEIELPQESQLATMQAFAQRLPQFLGAPDGSTDWSASLGTTDAGAYEAFLQSGDELFAPDATGFTAPPRPDSKAALELERLETLARRQRNFARARALLSLAYLSVGGEDQASLSKLAEAAAERALTTDAELADARAALGIVRARRMEWGAAQEHFAAALALDASSLPALEGLGCLLMDVGHVRAAAAIAMQGVALQPNNHGARRCATYARIAAQTDATSSEGEPADIARIHATMALLAGNHSGAEGVLRANNAGSDELIRSIIDASTAKQKIPEALQVVTRSADEESIDAETEILFGTALRRPDFVFNRMLRLARQSEAVPLRVLWLPQTDFLRKHRRFKEVVSAAALTTYWRDHGVPDVCAVEPKVHGCAVKPK